MEKIMQLTEEIQQAAQSLGKCLKASPAVQAYLETQAQIEADPQAAALEQQMAALPQAEPGGALLALRMQARTHPLLTARDAHMGLVRTLFARIGSELSSQLGADYSTLAGEEPKGGS
jgi:hypothetical protein